MREVTVSSRIRTNLMSTRRPPPTSRVSGSERLVVPRVFFIRMALCVVVVSGVSIWTLNEIARLGKTIADGRNLIATRGLFG